MHTSRIVGLLLLVIVQNMHSSLTPRPGSSKNTGSVPVPTAIKIKKPPDEAGWFVNFGGGVAPCIHQRQYSRLGAPQAGAEY